jgi:hypothetical protein
MVLIYRPPAFLKDSNGKNFEPNETHVICQKAKPKGIAKLGQVSVFWDWKKNRYYCYEGNQQLYSCETMEDLKAKPLTPSKDFTQSIKAEGLY